MRSCFGIIGVFLLLGVSSAQAQVTPELLMYRGFAHEARDRQAVAEVEHVAARIRLRRAQFQFDMKGSLLVRQATSAFEMSDATLELARARQNEATTATAMANADVLERVWKLRALSLEKSEDHTREIAELYVKARTEVVKVAESGLVNIRPIVVELNFQFDRSRRLYSQNAISREELFLIETTADEAGTFVPFAEREIARAKASLAEAQQDLDSIPVAKPNP